MILFYSEICQYLLIYDIIMSMIFFLFKDDYYVSC